MANYADWRAVRRRLLTSKKWRRCDDAARVLWLCMLLNTDSHGVIESDPEQIKSVCLPDVPGWNEAKVVKALTKLASTGLIERYESGGKSWAWLVDFDEHQHYELLRKRSLDPPNPMPPKNTARAGNAVPRATNAASIGIGIETDTEPPTANAVAPQRLRTDPTLIERSVAACIEKCGPAVAPMVDDLTNLLAAENKTGTIALTRVHRVLWEPISTMVAELGERSVMEGIRSALSNNAPNANYVKKAAESHAKRHSRAKPQVPMDHRTSVMSAYVQPVGATDE